MKFNIWNSILCYHFFSRNDVQIFLSIDKDEIENIAVESEEFKNQLKLCGKTHLSLDEKKRYAWNDFIFTFGEISNGKWQCSKSKLLADFQKKIIESGTSHGAIPTIFPYIALFVIPLSNDPELNVNAFYPKINDFFKKQCLIKANESISSTDMAKLCPGLDYMWNCLSEWASANDYEFRVSLRSSSGRAQYAAPFVSQLIFTAAQRENFKLLFFHAGLTPSQDISDEYSARILSNHYTRLGISKQRWDVIRKNYLDSAISIFHQELDSWDGIALVRRRDNNIDSQEYLGVSQSFLLSVSSFRGNFNFGLYAQLKDTSFGEEFAYESNNCGSYEFATDNFGLANTCIWNDEICKSIASGTKIIFNKVGDNKVRLSYSPNDIEILEYSFNRFITTNSLQKGRKYAVLITRGRTVDFSEWLTSNDAQLITKHQLYSTHSLYIINSAKTDFSAANISKLQFNNKIELNLVNTITLGKNDDGALKIYKGLPAYFKISGIDVSTDNVRAVFNSEGRIDNMNLIYDEESDVWMLPKVQNLFMQKKQFKIFCNDIAISSTRYIVSDFIALNSSEYEEIRFNSYGEHDESGSFEGLKISNSNDINWNNLTQSMKREGCGIVDVSSNYTPTDFLLYYLSSRPKCERKDFIEIIDVLIQNKQFESNNENRWAIHNLIDNYFRLGYINCAYINGKHIIAINKPTFILLPPRTKRECINVNSSGKGIYTTKQLENFWTVLVTGARTPKDMESLIREVLSFRNDGDKIHMEVVPSIDRLLPQTIYLRAYNLSTIEKFAAKINYSFQKCIYANILLKLISSVDDYIKHVVRIESSEKFDSISNFVRVDYSELAKSGYYKKSYSLSKDNSVVTYFPGTYRETTIFWSSGKQYCVDKYWGHLIGMTLENAKIINVNGDNNMLELPISLQLPQLYARALTMVSGKIPIENDRLRKYEIYNNPYTLSMDSTSILRKLSQNI